MTLVLVESPTKARTLSRFLGKDYQIEATMGHIRDLPNKRFGVQLKKNKNTFEIIPEYEASEGKSAQIAKLRKASKAKNITKIILATDPDREGEAIAWHAAVLLNGGASKFSRVVFHEITSNAILEAIRHPRTLDMNLIYAQQARRILDRVVGYKLSPLLWKKIRRGLSAGRVQSVAVRLIVDREKEILAFVPEEYWEIFVEVARRSQPAAGFTVKLIEIDGQKFSISQKTEVDPVVADLKNAEYTVSDIENKEVRRRPYPPFTTSTLQQSASRLFRWSSKKTMMIAQQLYEHGYITYHRTDSFNIAREALASARDYISRNYENAYLPPQSRYYKSKSIHTQEAHEAIRPANVLKIDSLDEISTVIGRTGKEGVKLFELIWKRFIACQMSDQIYDQTTVNVAAKAQKIYKLQTQGQVEKFAGWRILFQNTSVSPETPAEINRSPKLPQFDQGEILKYIQVTSKQNFTQPPPRYTEATLIKALETKGIGRPSTYAPIISTIQGRGYVEKNEGRFTPTPIGTVVTDYLIQYFKDIVDYDFTRDMESNLDAIAEGSERWEQVIGLFWEPFSIKLAEVEKNSQRQKIPAEETGEKCPQCQEGSQVIRTGKFGKFLSCSRFPQCKWKARYIEKTGFKCPDCREGDIIVKKTRRGKIFYGCSNYPQCKWASWKKPAAKNRLNPV